MIPIDTTRFHHGREVILDAQQKLIVSLDDAYDVVQKGCLLVEGLGMIQLEKRVERKRTGLSLSTHSGRVETISYIENNAEQFSQSNGIAEFVTSCLDECRVFLK